VVYIILENFYGERKEMVIGCYVKKGSVGRARGGMKGVGVYDYTPPFS
jgi:hypothetical protein